MPVRGVNLFIVIQLTDFTKCPLGPGSVLELGGYGDGRWGRGMG